MTPEDKWREIEDASRLHCSYGRHFDTAECKGHRGTPIVFSYETLRDLVMKELVEDDLARDRERKTLSWLKRIHPALFQELISLQFMEKEKSDGK